jgi:hypothetical protein
MAIGFILSPSIASYRAEKLPQVVLVSATFTSGALLRSLSEDQKIAREIGVDRLPTEFETGAVNIVLKRIGSQLTHARSDLKLAVRVMSSLHSIYLMPSGKDRECCAEEK